MKPTNRKDQNTVQEIASIQNKIRTIIEQAKLKEKNHLLFEAEELYREAQQLSFHAGEGLKVKIVNESTDIENWHRLNNKIEELQKVIQVALYV